MLDPNCSICKCIIHSNENNTPLEEIFNWIGGSVAFDIDKARKIVSDGREMVQIKTELLSHTISYTGKPNVFNLFSTRIVESHIDHVPDSETDPIILSWLEDFQLPIDGNHRIARAVKYKQPFVFAYLLSKEESGDVLMHRHGYKTPA